MDTSRFRFTDCQAARPDQCVLGVMPSGAIWDSSNVISSNGTFVAVPWAQSGSAAVLACNASGKLPGTMPLVRGHGSAVIETAFDPFNANLLMTASEDGCIRGYKIPTSGVTEGIDKPDISLDGHSRKCGILAFHPSAQGVLASAGTDTLVNIWDVAREAVKLSIRGHNEYATGLDWNLDGSLLCTTDRNKNVNVIDPRTESILSSSVAHQSARTQRCMWAKRHDKIVTLGWDSGMRRQIKLWDPRNMKEEVFTHVMDQSGSAMMPLFDEDLSLIYIGSRGEGGVKCFEVNAKGIMPSFDYSSFDPLRGVCAVPKQCLDVKKCEIGLLYTLTSQSLSSVRLVLPRRNAESSFQSDVFPPTFSADPALNADQFFDGKNAKPNELSLEYLFSGVAPPPTVRPSTTPTPMVSRTKTTNNSVLSRAKSNNVDLAPRHVDPTTGTNVSPALKTDSGAQDTTSARDFRATNDGQSEAERLLRKYRTQQAEVNALRNELSQKETEMMSTLEQLEKALGAS